MINDLHISLMAVAVMIVIGVMTYNQWQKIKTQKRLERAILTTRDDALMTKTAFEEHSAPRLEPHFDPSPPRGLAANPPQPTMDEINAINAAQPPAASTTTSVARTPEDPSLLVDPIIDCPFLITLGQPILGADCLPIVSTLRHVGHRAVRFVGDDGHDWQDIVPEGRYVQLLAGVQMANRSGALNDIEFSDVLTQVRHIAHRLDGEVDVFDLPDMTRIVNKGKRLYQFIQQHDVQLSINIKKHGVCGAHGPHGTPWAVNTLMVSLHRQGFEFKKAGTLVMAEGDLGPLFSLFIHRISSESREEAGAEVADFSDRLSLILDVTQVAPERQGFHSMTQCAKTLAAHLGGVIVDDRNQPLSEAQLIDIGRQVNAFYREMAAFNIPAGCPRARRLFG